MMHTRFTKNFINTIQQQVNVVGSFDLLKYDQDFDSVKEYLQANRKDQFGAKDFFLVSHYDPEYYLPKCPYGLTTFNLVRTFQEVDISLSRLIIGSNRTGYLEEFKQLIPKELHQWELPIVFDQCLSAFNNNSLDNFKFSDIAVNSNKIKTNMLSMMRCQRLHRNTLYNFIKDNNLFNSIAIAYNNES
jgi:hypothetical protein